MRPPEVFVRELAPHELVPTPTYASYLNRIEATFGAIDEFMCKNADYLDWDAFGHALAEHVRHRNSPAERERRKLEAARRRERRAAKTTTELKLAALNDEPVSRATLREAALDRIRARREEAPLS